MAFQKGQSGNPKGRKPGTTAGAKFRKSIEAAAPAILKSVIDAAKNGDVAAAKVLLDRVCPPLKPQAQNVTIKADGTLANQGAEIIKAALAGNLPPDIAVQLIGALAAQVKVIEVTELVERVAALEAKK